jgi:hypothetical protein
MKGGSKKRRNTTYVFFLYQPQRNKQLQHSSKKSKRNPALKTKVNPTNRKQENPPGHTGTFDRSRHTPSVTGPCPLHYLSSEFEPTPRVFLEITQSPIVRGSRTAKFSIRVQQHVMKSGAPHIVVVKELPEL